MTFHVKDYWPFDLVPKSDTRMFVYEGGLESVFLFDPDTDALKFLNYKPDDKHTQQWVNTWYLQLDKQGAVWEIRDDYPGKTLAFSPAIGWGNVQKVKDVYTNKPEYDTLRCHPPAIGEGTQTVVFEHRGPYDAPANHYPDVVQVACVQIWGHGTSWLRLWLAKGVGPVAWQFTEGGPILKALRVLG